MIWVVRPDLDPRSRSWLFTYPRSGSATLLIRIQKCTVLQGDENSGVPAGGWPANAPAGRRGSLSPSYCGGGTSRHTLRHLHRWKEKKNMLFCCLLYIWPTAICYYPLCYRSCWYWGRRPAHLRGFHSAIGRHSAGGGKYSPCCRSGLFYRWWIPIP